MLQKTHPFFTKDGKNCYEKEKFTSYKKVNFKCIYFYLIMKTYLLLFQKKIYLFFEGMA